MKKLSFIFGVLGLGSILSACALGYVYHITPEQNPLITYNDQIQESYAKAFTGLLNCPYFTHLYPRFRKELLKHTTTQIGYSAAEDMRPYYAITDIKRGIIVLSPNYFNADSDQRRAGILAHELLHLSGMPRHVWDIRGHRLPTREEKWADPISQVEAACFHPLEYFGPIGATPPIPGLRR